MVVKKVNTSLLRCNIRLFSLWLKREKRFTDEMIQNILQHISIIDDFTAKYFPNNIPVIFSINDPYKIQCVIQQLITNNKFKIINNVSSDFLLKSINHYFSFLRIQSDKKKITIDILPETMLYDILIDEQYHPLVYALHKDGIYTIGQYQAKFQGESLIHYLNSHDLYAWQKRVKIVESVNELMGENKVKPKQTQTENVAANAVEAISDVDTKQYDLFIRSRVPLPSTRTDDTAHRNIIVGYESTEPEQINNKSKNIEIWNDYIEQNFKIWMKSEKYASSTTCLYCNAVKRTIQNLNPLVNSAVSEANTLSEAVRKFVSLLNQDRKLIDAYSTTYGQLSAALAAFERFVDSDIAINTVSVVTSPKKTNNNIFNSMIVTILTEHFSNGFRLNSPIELLRFRRFAAERFGDEISMTDEELMEYITSCGTLFDGKIYVISLEIVERIQKKFEIAFANGEETVFFETFYDKHEEWLFPAGVVSVDMLKKILQKLYQNYVHKSNYLTRSVDNKTELARIECEIVRVWGENVLRSCFWLAEHLPYIPLEKIKYVLAYSDEFIRNSEGVYAYVNKIDITEEERVEISDYVAKKCLVNGYASLNDIPIDEIQERNYELTITAIHNAVFRICLVDKYDRNGKIVTRKGDTLDALTIIKDYCRTIDKCSLDDLLNYEKELTGKVHRWLTIEAGNAVLVRIDKNTYVSEKYVNFDTIAIDNAIALFVTDDYLPLKSFTTFVAFPNCGQVWNLFLLESYCRRFSKRFRFATLSVNSRNAGAVIRKSCSMTYIEIMADAVVKSGIPYEEKAVGRFLYENGYTGKSTIVKASEIIKQAKTMRERRE